MEYREFLNYIKRELISTLPEGTDVIICHLPRNNGVFTDSFVIRSPGTAISPAVEAVPFFELYRNGTGIEEILQKITGCCSAGAVPERIPDSFFSDPEAAKTHIVCRLINQKQNELLLSQVPHRRFLDLAVVYYYMVDEPELGKGSILIRNEHLHLWDIDEEELNRFARKNTERLCPVRLARLDTMMKEMFGFGAEQEDSEETPLYVLTNKDQVYGAFWITEKAVLDEIASRIGGGFYVLPSSIHECMVLRDDYCRDEAMLEGMVTEINRECVAHQDILADSVYKYRKEEGELKLVSG